MNRIEQLKRILDRTIIEWGYQTWRETKDEERRRLQVELNEMKPKTEERYW